MNILKRIFRHRIFSIELELVLLGAILLLYPLKNSSSFPIVYAILFGLAVLKNVALNKNISFSRFAISIIAVNLIALLTTLLSSYVFASFLFIADLSLFSLLFIWIILGEERQQTLFKALFFLFSLFSFLVLVIPLLTNYKISSLFFDNPIHTATVAGLGVTAGFYFIRLKNPWIYACLSINILAVYATGSKSAFLGIVLILFLLTLKMNRKLIGIIALVIIATVIIPNPVKQMFLKSIYQDPYALNRLQIWQQSINMFLDHPIVGIGADNFAVHSRIYNFKQAKGPANYFKVPKFSHSDPLKLLTEHGVVAGVLLLSLFLFLYRRRHRLLETPQGLMMLFLLFQSFLFNFYNKPFFLFLWFLLLKAVFDKNTQYMSPDRGTKYVNVLFLSGILLFGFILPYKSLHMTKSAVSPELNFLEKDDKLETAVRLMPLNPYPWLGRAQLHFDEFKNGENFDLMTKSLYFIRKGKSIHRYLPEFYNLEFDIYQYYYAPHIYRAQYSKFMGLSGSGLNFVPGAPKNQLQLIHRFFLQYKAIFPILNELIAKIREHEKIEPLSPFIQFNKSLLLLQKGDMKQAAAVLEYALKLEPRYLGALLLYRKHFASISELPKIEKRIEDIRTIRRQAHPRRGTYLYNLFYIKSE